LGVALTSAELAPGVESELKISKDEVLHGGHRDEIRELLVKRGVLIVRDLDLAGQEQREFASMIDDPNAGRPLHRFTLNGEGPIIAVAG